jgi:esterase/lipase superfamily enzyme
MVVATTRQRSSDGSRLFTGERAQTITLAEMVVSVPPDSARVIGEVQWPRANPPDPAREFATLSARIVEIDEAQSTLRRLLATKGHGRVLVFVHGYNNRFADAVFSLAQIAHDSRAPAVPVLFTWPSRGRLMAYAYDRASTNTSRDALEGVLTALVNNPRVTEISILAHSMGNWLTLETLRQMAIRSGRVPVKIRQVMLAAPDVDVDEFRAQLNAIGPVRPQMTLFVSRDDRALAVSQRVWGSVARLGAVDPNVEPYRSHLARERIAVIDLTGAGGADPLHHSRFAELPDVVRSIGRRLASGQPLHGREHGLTEHIGLAATHGAAVVGAVAGIAISAPLAAVDPDGHESLEEQLRHMQQQGQAALGRAHRR